MTASRVPRAAPVVLSVKQEQGVRSREEILDAAERLMSARGYAATSISVLAEQSGLPASSIYWHFGSKSGVLGAVMERGSRRFFHDVGASPTAASDDPRERLRDLMQLSVDTIRNHPQFLRLFIVLLLGAEGEHAQDEVVARVRTQGAGLMWTGVRHAYEAWGEALARQVADELGELALALFDGLFVAIEAAGDDGNNRSAALIDHIVTALHAVAVSVRERTGSARTR